MARRSLFTVVLAVVLVLTTSANPQASEVTHSTSASPKNFSVKMDGRAPASGSAPKLALSSARASGARRGT